jgi:NAD-dependent dihydropyrimidine dehydrogenase PreA subunit
MNKRFEQLQNIVHREECFKTICGAGNEDKAHVKKLSFVYTLAGTKILDVSANVDVVKAAMEGIDLAYEYTHKLNVKIEDRPYIMVSVGMPGDPHVRKSFINADKCIGCTLCIPICPTDAIPKDFVQNLNVFKNLGGVFDIEDQSKEIVIKDLCIGCGKCSSICPKNDIISYRHNAREIHKLLPKCMEAGAELFELHAAVGEDDITLTEWSIINEINSNNYNSMCLDRLNLGNLRFEHRINEARKIAGNRLMIQADGYPMSGGEDDYNTTLQAVACADVVNKKFNMRIDKKRTTDKLGKPKISSKKVYKNINDVDNIPILISGGTNSYSKELAEKAEVRINGVSIGTFARDLIEKFIVQPDFYENDELIKLAYENAKNLIQISNKKI